MNLMTLMKASTPDYTAIKAKQNAIWASGDYAKIGSTLQITGEELAEAADVMPGMSVLDVAAGNGNATLAFARRFAHVTSTDYVASLLERGRARAEAEGMDVAFFEADAEDLPFDDNSFDMTVSTFGVMFTPNQKRAANEMIRVTRSGGKIAMANWTPEGFVGGLFKAIGKNVPPPAGLNPPSFWGKSDWIDETFGPSASAIMFGKRNFNFRYMSPGHFVDYFRTFYGPTHKAFLTLDEMGQVQLENDIRDVIAEYNVATDGTVIIPSEYAQIVVARS